MEDAIRRLEHTPIVIFQGEQDRLAKLENIAALAKQYANLELLVVDDATHNNTVELAGARYFEKLCELLECLN